MLVGVFDMWFGEVGYVYVVLWFGVYVDVDELNDWVCCNMVNYKVLRYFMFVV